MAKSLYIAEKPSVAREFAKALKINGKNKDGYLESQDACLLYTSGVSTLAIDGVEPTLENTYNGTYPVWTYEHMYTNGEPNEVVKAFLDFVMSDEYGAQMEDLGYGVSSKMTTEH